MTISLKLIPKLPPNSNLVTKNLASAQIVLMITLSVSDSQTGFSTGPIMIMWSYSKFLLKVSEGFCIKRLLKQVY
jgi:hypothetical protein